jgi:hypothetical protein
VQECSASGLRERKKKRDPGKRESDTAMPRHRALDVLAYVAAVSVAVTLAVVAGPWVDDDGGRKPPFAVAAEAFQGGSPTDPPPPIPPKKGGKKKPPTNPKNPGEPRGALEASAVAASAARPDFDDSDLRSKVVSPTEMPADDVEPSGARLARLIAWRNREDLFLACELRGQTRASLKLLDDTSAPT